ncbi:unnamed protein product [Schistocephalus solidus]|uniref:Calmodulin n=2 Tax=Schistocephalus solidus TaxID=70667 RepID=A0A183SF97_SCHSO|nr:unnamed protein product [Schistocephalus solidus]
MPSRSDVKALLESLDTDKSGTVSAKEFLSVFRGMGITEADLKEFIKSIDKNGDGELDIDELADYICNKK